VKLPPFLERRPAWLGPLVALAVVYAIFGGLTPDTFLRSQNTISMAQKTVVVATCSVGMTMVIATGGIDLSTGSIVAFTAVLVARLLRAGYGAPSAVLLALLAAAAVGALVGLLVGRFKMMPFIVTLGTMSILRGAAKGLADEQKIDAPPRGLERLVSADLSSPSLWITLSLAVFVSCLLLYTRFGRHVFAVGSNEATARLCGIDTVRVKVLVYALSSLLAGAAGVMEFSTLTVGDPTDAVGLELKVIAAVVIGGAPLTGGEGSIAGSVLGALLMTVIDTGGVHRGWQSWVQEIVTGVIIVVAVALDRARHRRSR
jgi:ribose transport system permease protein